MNERRSIKLNMKEYRTRKEFYPQKRTQEEKEARLYALAKKLNVRIGVEK